MTRILELELSHFRSHKRTRLSLDGRPVALAGPNGAGKTNLLEAVSLLSPGRGLRRAAPEDLPRRPESIGWKISALLDTPEGPRQVETFAPAGGGARSVRIDGKAAPQTQLGALAPMLWLTPSMDGLWTGAASERRRFVDRAALGFDPAHAERSLTYEKAMRERNRLLRDQLRDAAWFDALESRMALSGAAIARARVETVARLNGAQPEGGPFPTAALALEGACERRFTALRDADGLAPDEAERETAAALRTALARGRARDLAAGRTLDGPHRSDLTAVFAAKGVEARLCSTGEQKALLISVTLANARAVARQRATPPLLLLDEVAAHLDEGRRAALFDALTELGAQAWMTGADRALFAGLGARAQLFETVERDGVATVSPAA
ncbi:DNA replication/repair protein RecF [Oceanicella actignis]|uniref:DNA replication and repair protein RecF n=1 Tax=Oceanicella actignis TaxID=1189325 RepID=A0A1M7T630_9RHOB|nr:DNA replication/repair protein RecF [Oceanicella actignis]TYO84837.1 DNA replication and repair protein RecF [Oceanicella actignis]SET44250.1 DNA replication and repair protein RecF [Oceanicella actignis]SHN66204.1 DNA replication and repair protein RecF [Oceanicella actignis]